MRRAIKKSNKRSLSNLFGIIPEAVHVHTVEIELAENVVNEAHIVSQAAQVRYVMSHK